jgi:hypothetical protein
VVYLNTSGSNESSLNDLCFEMGNYQLIMYKEVSSYGQSES